MKFIFIILILVYFVQGIIVPQKILSTKTVKNKIDINGILNEKDWMNADSIYDFTQIEPEAGRSAVHKTVVKVLYNSEFLYFGGICYFTKKNEEIRVIDFYRDFDITKSDCLGIIIDLFNDKRNATAFFINPLGAQRDETIIDGNDENLSWNTKWYDAVVVNDYGWSFEIAIPWSSVRFSTGTDSIGINFIRLDRKTNELSAWVPYPRNYSMFRLTYEGILKGLTDLSTNKGPEITPYMLFKNNSGRNRSVNGISINNDANFKPGADIKFAINSGTFLDATINTDFTQADIDKEIINLTEFDITLPENRQFFLESAGLFNAGNGEGTIKPFFSRRIGIDDNNNAVPMDGGVRFVHKDIKNNYGLLMALTRIPDSLNSFFITGRYTQNFGNQNRFGFITTYRRDKFHYGVNNNIVGGADGVIRFNEKISLTWLASGSLYYLFNNQNRYGYSQSADLNYLSESVHLYLNNYLVSKDYFVESGFVAAKNISALETGIDLYLRPKWKPGYIRDFEPGFYLNYYRNLSNGKLRQAYFTIWPVYILFQDGMIISAKWLPTWENLYSEFNPAKDIIIKTGKYLYNRYECKIISDPSAAFSYSLNYETGSYFDGSLYKLITAVNYIPIPNISFSLDYEPHWLKNSGISKINKKIEIASAGLKLALNTKIGLEGFYQYSSEKKSNFISLRFSWEYLPLSYFYIVYNSGNFVSIGENYFNQNQLLLKLSYQYQL